MRYIRSIYFFYMKPISATFIDIRRLRVLRELHDRRTVVATARAVHLTPSAVSQQMAALAREVGVPLTVRHGRGVRLTPQALLLLEHAAVMLTQMERARADLDAFGDRDTRPIAIGAFATVIESLVAPALRTLQRQRSRTRLVVREAAVPEAVAQLDAGELDLIVAIDYHRGPHRTDPRYARRDLLLDPYDVVLPVTHRFAGRRAIELAALAEETWILGHEPCAEVTRAACISAGFSLDARHTVNDWRAVFALVAAGAGIALAPRLAAAADAEGVVLCRLAGAPASRNIYAAVRAGGERSPAIVAVLAALEKAARAAHRRRPP